MSRCILSLLFGALVWFCTASGGFGQFVPAPQIAPDAVRVANPYAAPVSGEERRAQMAGQRKIKALQTRLQSGDLDAAEEQKTTAELKEIVETMFDDEIKMMKKRLAQMQAKLDERVAGREKFIEERIEKVLNAPKPGDLTFQIKEVKKKKDGSSVATVMFLRAEMRTRTVSFTEMVAEERVRKVDGKEQSYTVVVPVTRQQEQEYTVTVPVSQESVPIPAGEDARKAVKNYIDEADDF